MSTIKLTKRTAYELISRISTGRNIKKDDTSPTSPTVEIYRASTGPSGLEITCENDWYDYNGLIKLTISDGENQIVHYYSPTTLERERAEEQEYKNELERERRVEWVSCVGREQAHKMVDRYWYWDEG